MCEAYYSLSTKLFEIVETELGKYKGKLKLKSYTQN